MKRLLIALVALLALIPAAASAQDKKGETPKFGLTFPDIGVIWHISDKVAFVPSATFLHNWSSFDSDSIPDKNSGNSVTVNAALRFYVHEWKGIRFYVAPKYGFGRTTSSSQFQAGSASSESNSHSIAGAWGLEYAATDRISLFGDIGVRYSHSKSENINSATLGVGNKNNFVGTVGTWGLILYLK